MIKSQNIIDSNLKFLRKFKEVKFVLTKAKSDAMANALVICSNGTVRAYYVCEVYISENIRPLHSIQASYLKFLSNDVVEFYTTRNGERSRYEEAYSVLKNEEELGIIIYASNLTKKAAQCLEKVVLDGDYSTKPNLRPTVNVSLGTYRWTQFNHR